MWYFCWAGEAPGGRGGEEDQVPGCAPRGDTDEEARDQAQVRDRWMDTVLWIRIRVNSHWFGSGSAYGRINVLWPIPDPEPHGSTSVWLPGSGADWHWVKKLDPDPHWSQGGSTTLVLQVLVTLIGVRIRFFMLIRVRCSDPVVLWIWIFTWLRDT